MPGLLVLNREVKRVPLDFEAPLNRTWQGYVMPDSVVPPPCPSCGPASRDSYADEHGDGLTIEARAIETAFYGHNLGGNDAAAWHDKLGQAEVDNLVEQGRLRELREVPEAEQCGEPCDHAPGAVWAGEPCRRFKDHDGDHYPRPSEWITVPRTAAEVNRVNGRAGLSGHGRAGLNSHDAINQWILVEFRCRVLGIELRCATCRGKGYVASEEASAAYENWAGTDPPRGDAFQMWQTTSEGSPITPPFASAQDLALYCAEHLHKPGTRGEPMDSHDWLRVIEGLAFSVDIETGDVI